MGNNNILPPLPQGFKPKQEDNLPPLPQGFKPKQQSTEDKTIVKNSVSATSSVASTSGMEKPKWETTFDGVKNYKSNQSADINLPLIPDTRRSYTEVSTSNLGDVLYGKTNENKNNKNASLSFNENDPEALFKNQVRKLGVNIENLNTDDPNAIYFQNKAVENYNKVLNTLDIIKNKTQLSQTGTTEDEINVISEIVEDELLPIRNEKQAIINQLNNNKKSLQSIDTQNPQPGFLPDLQQKEQQKIFEQQKRDIYKQNEELEKRLFALNKEENNISGIFSQAVYANRSLNVETFKQNPNQILQLSQDKLIFGAIQDNINSYSLNDNTKRKAKLLNTQITNDGGKLLEVLSDKVYEDQPNEYANKTLGISKAELQKQGAEGIDKLLKFSQADVTQDIKNLEKYKNLPKNFIENSIKSGEMTEEEAKQFIVDYNSQLEKVNSKLKAIKYIEDTGNQYFGDYKRFEYYKEKQNELAKNFNFRQDIVGAVQSGTFNNVLDAVDFGKTTATKVKSALGVISPEQEAAQYLKIASDQDFDYMRYTPDYFKTLQFITKDEKGENKINPRALGYAALKTTAESYMLYLTGLGITKATQLNRLKNYGKVGEYVADHIGIIPASELYIQPDMFNEAMKKYESGEISLDQVYNMSAAQAGIEGATEMWFLPEAKALKGVVNNSTKQLALNLFFKSKIGKDLVGSFGEKAVKAMWEGTKIGGGEAWEEILGNIFNDQYNYQVKQNNPDYVYQEQNTLDSNAETAINTFISMYPTILLGMGTSYRNNNSQATAQMAQYEVAQNPSQFNQYAKDFIDNTKNLNWYFPTQSKEEVYKEIVANNTKLSEIYNQALPVTSKLDSESEKIDYFNTLNNFTTLSSKLNLTKEQEEELDALSKKIIFYKLKVATSDALKETDPVKYKATKIENFIDTQDYDIQDVTKLALLGKTLNNSLEEYKDKEGYEALVEKIQSKINLVNENISKLENKSTSQEKVDLIQTSEKEKEQIQDIQELSVQDYAFQILNLSKKEIEDLEARGELENIVSKDKVQKEKVNNITSQFEEAKALPTEEKADRLSELSLQAAEEGLFDLAKQIDEYKEQNNTVVLGDTEYNVGQQVDYQGSVYTVAQDENTGEGFLVDKQGRTPVLNNPQEIKPISTETKSEKETVTEGQNLKQAFGIKEEIPTEDIEAKKADIEKRLSIKLPAKNTSIPVSPKTWGDRKSLANQISSELKGVVERGVSMQEWLDKGYGRQLATWSDEVIVEFLEVADIERRRQGELNQKTDAGYSTIALDYLFTGGRDVIQSTDYLLQALVGGFTSAAKEINNIRNKYADKLGNIKDDINSDIYNQMMSEIRDVINKKYNNSKATEIFDKVLKNATGFTSREGNQVSIELDKLNEQNESKINAKYDAELAALEQPKVEEKITEKETVAPTEIVEENDIIENTPVTNTSEAKEEAKENKRELDNPVNPFRNTYYNKETVFGKVISKLFNKPLNNTFVTVMSSQDIPWEQLPQKAKDYFKKDTSEKRKEDKGKYLVITDKQGNPILYTPEGEIVKDKGAWALEVFPNTKSETELSDAKFEKTNPELEKQGKTREWFQSQIKKIFEARQSKKPITYTIEKIHQGGYEVDVDTPISIKDSLKGKQAVAKIGQNGKAYFQIEGETTPNEINRPLFNQKQIDTILHIISNKGKNLTDTQERQQFVTKLIGEKFFRTVDGKQIELQFKFNKGLTVPQIKEKGQENFRNLTKEEFEIILSKITPNINKMLLEANNPFNYYEFNGKIVSKKVYPSYSDFIVDNFYTYNNVSSTEVKPEYYLEVGNPVDSITNTITEAAKEEPKVEFTPEKKEVKHTITKESSTQKTKKERSKYNIKDDTSFKDFLKRGKHLITKVTEQQEKEAKEWFESNPISEFINFRDFRNIVNSDAFATWSSSALTLYKDFKFTDLYHEAWHEFSQLYLTKAQKEALYNETSKTKEGQKAIDEYAKEIGKKVSDLTDLERYFAIEEMVAEDFLKYVLSNQSLILNGKPKRNSIFRKIFNFLKELFTGNSDLQTYYERLYTGNLNNYKRDLDNAFFDILNKGLEGVVNGEIKNLTNAETKQLYQGIDFIFGQVFQQSGKPVTLMFEKNNVVPKIYEKLLNYFKLQYDKSIERQSKLEPNSFEYEFEEKVLDNLQFTIDNWNNIVANHKRYSSFFKVSKDIINFDEEGNLSDTTDLEEDKDENNSRDASIVKNENVSSKEAASNETLYLIATLSTEEANPFFPMMGQLVDFKKTWDVLTKNLQNTLEYPELITKIQNLQSKYPWAKDLLQRLPDPNKELLTDEEQRLKAAFLNDIGKPKVDSYEVVFDEKLNIKYSKSAATDERKLKNQWDSNFTNLTPDDSEFIKYDEQDNTYLDVVELVDNYKSAFPILKKNYEILDKKQLFEDRLNFLFNFGIVFSEEATSSSEFFDFITDFNSPVKNLFKLTQVLESQKPNSYNPIKDLSNVKLTKEDRDIEYFSRTFPKIVNKELQYSSDFFTQSVKNAANNTVWQIRQWNYISKIYNAINDVNKYPTYQDLINEPWLKQLSINSNPYVNGVFLNSIFDLNTGKRRKDRNGNYVTIDFQDYNGLVLNLGTGTKNEGKTTTDLNSFEKLVQNFNTLLLYGVQEHLRYGDKSSSFSTKVSHIYNPITNELENSSLIIPIDKFIDKDSNSIIIPGVAFAYLKNNLKAELIPMKNNFENQVGNNWKYYRDNIKSLAIFEGILSPSTIDNLIRQYVETSDANLDKVIEANSKDIDKDIQNYLRQERKKLDGLLSNPLLSNKNFISPSLLQKANFEQLKVAYIVNSLLYNIEHTKLVTQDPRFYKAKGGKKDPFKRFSAWSATGNLFLTDKQTNDYIQSKGRAIKDAVAKKLGIEISPKIATGMLNSVIFNDAKYDSKELIKQYTEYFKSKGYSQEQIDKLLEKYTDITEADGQGYTTLDEYRESKLRAGSSHWTKAHEAAYQKEADFLAGKRIQGMSEEELVLFVPQKWQYAGTTIDNGFTVPVFYKFSVAPLIPSMIKNTSFEEIHDNLVKQNIGLALFESGSKLSGITNEDGKFNQFYSDYNERTPFTEDYTINPIFYNYLKEQVNVEPELKGKVTFSTQMRKLLHLNLFKEGKPIHPKAVELEKKFADVIEKLISLEKETVISQMGATLKDGKYTFNAKKLQEFFVKEFEERGLPDEVIDFFQVGENGQFTYPLDASNRRDKIEKIIYSIANKRLVQQKVNGEALIQLAATGFELNSDKLKEVKEDAGLPFYRVVNGVTQAMKVKIAFSEKWKPLLKLNHPDNQPIETLDRLNEAIKDEKWLKENHKKITIVGVRIPVQGLNSQEFMEVYHFLPESAGNVIIVSPYLVAKSGGDFDIDKLTTFFPNLDNQGNLYNLTSEEGVENKYNSLIKEYKKAVNQGKDEATDKLIAAIFNVSPKKLEQERKNELIEEIFGKEQIPSFEKFKAYTLKKSYENELIDLIRETLSLEENFEQLISPNSTDLLEPFAKELQKLEESAKGTWTELVEFSEIGRQFKSNLVGKYNLGIAAVWNTFFALSQRGGLILNKEHTHTTSSGKKQKRKTRINLPHNTVDGKISLSGLMDVENEHKISKIFEQAINGFVDIAKDDWIFFINGVKEVVPTMLFTAAAGVNNKNMIAFFNQPIIKQYVKESQKYKSLFVKIKDFEAFKYGTRKAIEDIILSTEGITDPKLSKLIDTLKSKIEKEEAEDKSPFTYFEVKNILDYLNDKSEKDKSLFTTEKLNPAIFENKPLTPEENLQILAHFDELRDLANKVSNLQRSLNADTKKASDSAAIYDRKQKLIEVYNTGLFPKEPLEKMFNESTVKAFTNTKTGFDAFVGQLFTELLEISNHPVFNKITRELIQKDQNLLFQYKNSEAEKLTKTLKNDFITYLYQNNVFWEDSYNLIFDKVAQLFKPKTALANDLAALKGKYPDLIEEFPVLNQLVSDKNKDKTLVNIKLKSRLSDRDELNSAVYQIRQLLQFNNPAYTQEEQLEIQNFTKKFTKFAIIQSGLNSSIFNLMDLIPNEEYTKGIAPFIQGFKNILDTNELQAAREIKTFYNKFKINNPIFFSKQVDEDGVSTANYDNIRFKNYKTASASDVTGKKEIAKTEEDAQYIENLLSKTTILPNTNSATIKNNPNSLVLVENNAQLTATKGLKEDNYSSIITKESIGKPLLDVNFPKNQEIIDKFIKDIIEKSKKFTNIVFNEKGYGQHLLPENKRTFDYLSNQLYTYFGYQNPDFTPVNPTEVKETLAQEVIEQPIQNKEGVSELFESNPELANSVYEALGFTGAISLKSNLKNTGKTEQDLIDYLKKKYPEIKLNITNNPVWEKGKDILNQIIENEMGEEYWRNLYTQKNISNREEFESVKIPTIKNKFKPDFENVYHGTNSYEIDNNGNLILTPSKNFDGKTTSISFTQIPVVAQDYMLRKEGNIIIKINNEALGSNYDIESAEEIAVNGNQLFIVPKGQYEIITVPTLAEKMRRKYANEVEIKAEELINNAKSDLHLIDAIYSERITADNYSELQEYGDVDISEQAPEWYVPDEYLNSRAAKKVYEDIRSKINKEWVVNTLSNVLIEQIKNTGDYIASIEGDLNDISTYGGRYAPHQSTLFEELLNEIGLGYSQRSTYLKEGEKLEKAKQKQKEYNELIYSIENLVEKEAEKSVKHYNSPEQVKLREEQRERDKINKEITQNLTGGEIDELPFQKIGDRIIGQANIKAMTVLVDAVNKKADTIPHEYAHHYIAWFRNTSIVQEGIKRWGSEEALVQAIGEQVVKQKGEAWNWWKKFTNFIINLLSDKQLLQVLTDSFLNRTDLNDFTYNPITPQQKQQAQQVYSQYLEQGGSKQDIKGFKDFVQGKQFQKLTAEEKAKTIEQVTKEHRSIAALKDLSAKLAYRIGGKVELVNRTDVDWKGYNQGITSVLNEAYMTPDTPFHEILAHPIIRAIKNIEDSKARYFLDNEGVYKNGNKWYHLSNNKGGGIVLDSIEDVDRFLVKENTTTLYQNLIKELETGRGKEVFEQVKRDYVTKEKPKSKNYNLIDSKNNSEIEIIQNFGNYWFKEYNETLNRGNQFNTNEELESLIKKEQNKHILNKYTLEEQQEEAIVTLLGMMAADKLDAKKDATLISKLKELWKQISDFVKSLLKQDGIKIDELPITTTLNDLAEIMAYGNNKIILPGYKVEYSTPLGNKYDTLEEVNNEVRGLADTNVEVDLKNVNINKETKILYEVINNTTGEYEIFETEEEAQEYKQNSEYEDAVNTYRIREVKDKNNLKDFIEKNKEYEQSKEIIEQWKKENNIQYDPEEVYSRGQGFYSSIGAYSNLELDLLLKNLIQHIEDNKKAGGEFTISAFTKPIDKRLKHIEGTGDRVRFVIYPKSEHIKWAAHTDVYSGSVWDASEKVSKDKKSELLGVSFTKAPALRNINEVSPNLADIIDSLSYAHNELGIELTTDNFRIEYDDNIDYSTKKLIDNVNKILDDKYGKLEKPEIRKEVIKSEEVYELQWKNGNVIGRYNSLEAAKKAQFGEYTDSEGNKISAEEATQIVKGQPIEKIGKQPTQTRENTTSIESVKSKLIKNKFTDPDLNFDNYKKEELEIWQDKYDKWFIATKEKNSYGVPIKQTLRSFTKKENALEELDNAYNFEEKEYTSQAEINLKVAALKEVARKYPRSLITSKVVPINPNMVDNSEIQYSKVGSKQDIEGFKQFVGKSTQKVVNSSKEITKEDINKLPKNEC